MRRRFIIQNFYISVESKIVLWKVYIIQYNYIKFQDLYHLICKHIEIMHNWFSYLQLFKSNKHCFMYIVTYLNYIIQLVNAT
jgi:hypothetical protein